jgi:hypothetical protein
VAGIAVSFQNSNPDRGVRLVAQESAVRNPSNEYGNPKENNLQLKDEIRKRVAQKQITLQALILASDDPAKRPPWRSPG